MKIEIEIHEYKPKGPIKLNWTNDYRIMVKQDGPNLIRILANRDGLETLASHMLTLAQEMVPRGHHLHHDSGQALEDGSFNLIIELGEFDNQNKTFF